MIPALPTQNFFWQSASISISLADGADAVIADHLRQSFKPGEVTPEKSNEIGRKLALKLTKGNNAFIVCVPRRC